MEESNAFPAVVTGGGNIIHRKHQQNPENNSPVKSWLLWPRKYLRHWRESEVVREGTLFFSPTSCRIFEKHYGNNFSSPVNSRQPRIEVMWVKPCPQHRWEDFSLQKWVQRTATAQIRALRQSAKHFTGQEDIQQLNSTSAWCELQPFAFPAPHKRYVFSCNIKAHRGRRIKPFWWV